MHKPSVTYRTISLIMAFLLLISTSGLTMDMHFCQGKIKRVNLIGKAKTCAEVRVKKTSCHHNPDNQKQAHCSSESDHAGCCNNSSVTIDMDVDLPLIQTVDIDQVTDLIIAYLFVQLPTQYNNELPLNRIYRPPPLPKQGLQILFQQFLI